MKTVINDDGFDEFDEAMRKEEEFNKSLRASKGVPSRPLNIEEKRKEAAEIMAREDLPEDFPTAEESANDVVGRAFKMTYAPKEEGPEVFTPKPSYVEGHPRGTIGDREEKEARKSLGPVPYPHIDNMTLYPDNIRYPQKEELDRVFAEQHKTADAVVTTDGVFRHALEALDGLLDNPTENLHAIEAVTNVLSTMKQIDISDTINPLATRAGETPLRK